MTAILTPDRIPAWSEEACLVLWTEYFHLTTPFHERDCVGRTIKRLPSKMPSEERRLQGEFFEELVAEFYGEYSWERVSSYLVVERCSGCTGRLVAFLLRRQVLGVIPGVTVRCNQLLTF